jgi:hypothetical protein
MAFSFSLSVRYDKPSCYPPEIGEKLVYGRAVEVFETAVGQLDEDVLNDVVVFVRRKNRVGLLSSEQSGY